MSFSKIILQWYSENKRLLPWRNTIAPYNIWLSEIMLQQTRVAQGIPYYERFIKRFPTVFELAKADEQEVLKLWQGLGYYSRARNLHWTAKYVVDHLNGQFPNTYEELLKLKGIGDYTASAIASISFNRLEPVVDGNVYRVISRFKGLDMPINDPKANKYYKLFARDLMSKTDIRNYNQGIMEFGALHCTPQKPKCSSCPLQTSCIAFQTNKVSEYPIKIKKGKTLKRYFNYFVVLDQAGNTLLVQRTNKDIWQYLYEFPLLESEKELELKDISKKLPEVVGVEEIKIVYQTNSKSIVHKLSHQHLYTKFWVVKSSQPLKNGISLMEIESYPVPVLIGDYIKTFKNSYF
ncbi:A/G-specific adenine glycosylase [Eudoraea sp.]|uniref:A/G-specific adenine glycosylase n=1 Tax=Eudoraea sp. TaxID=1979955 RepID=UPI003C7559E7